MLECRIAAEEIPEKQQRPRFISRLEETNTYCTFAKYSYRSPYICRGKQFQIGGLLNASPWIYPSNPGNLQSGLGQSTKQSQPVGSSYSIHCQVYILVAALPKYQGADKPTSKTSTRYASGILFIDHFFSSYSATSCLEDADYHGFLPKAPVLNTPVIEDQSQPSLISPQGSRYLMPQPSRLVNDVGPLTVSKMVRKLGGFSFDLASRLGRHPILRLPAQLDTLPTQK